MMIGCPQIAVRKSAAAFTLMEVVISVLILAMVLSGLIYGYAQINRNAEWTAQSLVGQSYASDYVEQARGAQWNSQLSAGGPGTSDPMLVPTNYTRMDTNYTASGQKQVITTTVSVTSLSTNNIFIRQIRADSSWVFPLTGRSFTNTVVTQRAPDQ
jgi:Tfp pilus assembly protein PilV